MIPDDDNPFCRQELDDLSKKIKADFVPNRKMAYEEYLAECRKQKDKLNADKMKMLMIYSFQGCSLRYQSL